MIKIFINRKARKETPDVHFLGTMFKVIDDDEKVT